MGVNRISTGYLSQQAIFHIQQNLQNLSTLQEKIASGKNINRPSDDPVGFNRLLGINVDLSADERYVKNIQSALSEVNTTDSAITGVINVIHRARELTTQGATDTLDQNGRNAIASEVDRLIDQVVQLGNTSIGGKYIFSGMKTSTVPFTRSGLTVTYAGTPAAQNWQRQLEISKGITTTININGTSLLGSVAPNGAPPPTTSGSGLLRTLMELKENLLAGDTTSVRSRLDDLETDLTTVSSYQTQVGTIQSQLDLALNRIKDRQEAVTKQYSAIQEIDLPKTISDLNFQESVYQASLGVAGRVLPASLLDYLR